MRARAGITALGLLLLTACSDFPELDAAVSEEARRAPYPSLVPTEGLLVERDRGRLTAADGPALLQRARNLQARADIIRRLEVIDDATRERISPTLNRLGG